MAQSYEDWLVEVDRQLRARATSTELLEYDYWSEWAEGNSPYIAADNAVRFERDMATWFFEQHLDAIQLIERMEVRDA